MEQQKVAKTTIERDKNFMYFVKADGVWRVARKQPGKPKAEPEHIADIEIEMDREHYIYFLDTDGDIARVKRAIEGDEVSEPVPDKVATKEPVPDKVATKEPGDDKGPLPY